MREEVLHDADILNLSAFHGGLAIYPRTGTAQKHFATEGRNEPAPRCVVDSVAHAWWLHCMAANDGQADDTLQYVLKDTGCGLMLQESDRVHVRDGNPVADIGFGIEDEPRLMFAHMARPLLWALINHHHRYLVLQQYSY